MKRLIQYSVAATSLLVVCAALLIVPVAPEAQPVQAAESPSHKSYTDGVPGSDVKFEMIAVPGGTFTMGSPAAEPGRKDDEGPQHPVAILPFWMGKCEVTWDEYDLYWKNNPGNKEEQRRVEEKGTQKEIDAVSRPTPPYADETFGHGREGKPVIGVTHHAAMDYCRWLSMKTGKAYRLPTEAEWEYACRAGTKTAYSFGDDAKQLGDYAWFAGNSEELTHEVGKKKPNPWGLYDMHGNVWEWCLDHYQKDYYAQFPTDKPTLMPLLMPTDKRFSHVARGGSWEDKAEAARSASRRGSIERWIRQDPQRPKSIWWLTDAQFVGFRIVRAVEELPSLKDLHSKIRWDNN
jgi:formylglycine-generating enzyme required for sulfatase activity